MTDKEIIKALECCQDCNCKECPCCRIIDGGTYCTEIDEEEILDLINRQQAEIERLKKIELAPKGYSLKRRLEIKDIQAETIKEFANKLRAEAHPDSQGFYIVLIDQITALEKKMVGDIPKVEHTSLCETETYEVGE